MQSKVMVAALAAAGALWAQQVKLPASFDKLAEKASETVNVTLDAKMLGFASKFLSEGDKDEVEAKKIAGKLKGIYVRGYEFDKEGEYSMADVEEIRSQLKGAEWSQIVSSRSKKSREIAEIYVHKNGGMVIIAAEPKKLTVVNIVGSIGPDDVASLSGQFGIPEIKTGDGKNKKDTSKKDKDEEE